jgi:hypothetical protein
VDLVCAATELQALGVRVAPEYLGQLRRTASERQERARDVGARNRNQDRDQGQLEPISNHEFAYIAGYTDAGFPFGVRREDLEGGAGGESLLTTNDGPD